MKKILSMLLAVMMLLMTVISVSAAPNSFTPSIDAKDSPTIITQTDSNGKIVHSIIFNKNGHEITGVPAGGIIITPIAGADSAPDDIKGAIKNAQNQINGTDNLGDLSEEVNEYLSNNHPDIDASDLVVSQLFDIRLDDEYSEQLTDGVYFTVQLDISESFLFLLMLVDGKWTICKDYKVDGNILTLNLTGPTQIALVKSNYSPTELPADKNEAEVQSPQTGTFTNLLFITLGVLFALGAVLLMVMFAKNKQSR